MRQGGGKEGLEREQRLQIRECYSHCFLPYTTIALFPRYALARQTRIVERRRPRYYHPEGSQGGVREACAEQRVVQEGSSPSGAQMRGAISKSGGHCCPAKAGCVDSK